MAKCVACLALSLLFHWTKCLSLFLGKYYTALIILGCWDMFWNCVLFFSASSFLWKLWLQDWFYCSCAAVISVRLLRFACQFRKRGSLDLLRIVLNLQINLESIFLLTVLNLPIHFCWRCLYIYVDHFNTAVLAFSV